MSNRPTPVKTPVKKSAPQFKHPTTQDIIDHLKDQSSDDSGFATKEELDAAVQRELEPFDISKATDEERAILEGRPVEEAAPEEKPDTPVPQEFDFPSTSDDLDFTMDFQELGKVEVNEEERDLYIKTLLNDVPYELPVEVFPGFHVTVRSRTVFYDDLIYDMVRKYSEKGEILGLESGFTRLMRLLAGVQVTNIQGRDTEFVAKASWTRNETAEALAAHVKLVFDGFPLAKWNAVVKAVRVFDLKQKICNDRLLDRTFWEGANIS